MAGMIDEGNHSNTASSTPAESFTRLLGLLPEETKHLLLLEALETCGPACLVGLENARDAILYAAVRLDPALLRSVTSFLESEEEIPNEGDESDNAERYASEGVSDDELVPASGGSYVASGSDVMTAPKDGSAAGTTDALGDVGLRLGSDVDQLEFDFGFGLSR